MLLHEQGQANFRVWADDRQLHLQSHYSLVSVVRIDAHWVPILWSRTGDVMHGLTCDTNPQTAARFLPFLSAGCQSR